jgi:hypothetical protein
MIRLYKNLKRSPWNKQIDDMGEKTVFHVSTRVTPKFNIYPFNIYPNSSPVNGSAMHFDSHTILFETVEDLRGLVRMLQDTLEDVEKSMK